MPLDDGAEIDEMSGLSSLALTALCDFLTPNISIEADISPPVDPNTLLQVYTEGDTQMIASTLKRLQERDEKKRLHNLASCMDEHDDVNEAIHLDSGIPFDEHRPPTPIETSPALTALRALQDVGCAKLESALDASFADCMLAHINTTLESEISSDNRCIQGFGNVLERKNRYDMYVTNTTPVVQSCLVDLLQKSKPLGDLFHEMFDGISAPFHELSALISDPGSPSQPLHPDSKWTDTPILYTVFVALQDIDLLMGPTVLVPKSHTETVHTLHVNHIPLRMGHVSGLMQKGDCLIMDSRTLHHGTANVDFERKNRRVLFYFTVRNPAWEGTYPSGGSLFEGMSDLDTGYYYRQ
ncbi:hypothetical protein TrCOL_g7555 [Triparma columacea]|uniref:Uncharacterized protein n=1 Tax=Triparma columacea TaxID=722753 RepID=A0A9W7GNX3_9STRA|nr:hypothetical protein TrCOL_g7555 [Triparma columacea]